MGYALFKVKEFEDVGSSIPQVEAAIQDFAKFQKAVKLVSFRPFTNAVESLANMNAVSEGKSPNLSMISIAIWLPINTESLVQQYPSNS